jgi:RNA polymerase sigma factor (sigma-70 family)
MMWSAVSCPLQAGGNVERIDPEWLRQLIDAHGAALSLYARQWCNAPEDALQQALVDLVRQPQVPEQPVAWLFQAVRRRAMNWARGERRRAEHHRRASEGREAWFVDDREQAVDPEEIERMLRRLPALEREIVVARIWGELSFEEIAALVGVSTSAAHRRYQKALSLLGDMMHETLNPSETCHEPRT